MSWFETDPVKRATVTATRRWGDVFPVVYCYTEGVVSWSALKDYCMMRLTVRKLMERLTVTRRNGPSKPPRSFKTCVFFGVAMSE